MEHIKTLVRVRPSNEGEKNDVEVWTAQGESIGISSKIYHDLVRQKKFMAGAKVEFTFSKECG